MPRASRIHELTLESHVSNRQENNRSSRGALHEIGRQDCPDDLAHPPDTALAPMFAPHKAWLRMLREHNSITLNTYKEVFWFIPSICMFPLELAHRSFAAHIECHQYVIECIEQSSQALEFSGVRSERTHSPIRKPVTSIEHAMDIAIGAEGKPWVEASNARTARAA